MITHYDSLVGQEFNQFVFFLKPNMKRFVPDSNSPWKFLMLSCISKIVGKEDDNIIGKSVLGMFALMMKPRVVLDIPSYWQEVVNTQLMSLSLTGSFRFHYLIIYLFLYQNLE